MTTMLEIMNAALLAQGQEEIVSRDDGSTEFRILTRNWPMIVEAELEDGNYQFSRYEYHLAQQGPGSFGYLYGYALPSGVLHVRHAWTLEDAARADVDWAQNGREVLTSAENGISVEAIVTTEPDLWSANFTKGVQAKLEAVILRSVKEEASESIQMDRVAEIHFERARVRSSQARKEKPMHRKEARFVAARFGRGVGHGEA